MDNSQKVWLKMQLISVSVCYTFPNFWPLALCKFNDLHKQILSTLCDTSNFWQNFSMLNEFINLDAILILFVITNPLSIALGI